MWAQQIGEAGGTVEIDRGDWGRGLAVSVELEMGGQPISEHVMLLGAFLGDQGFQRTPKELLVALGSGADDIDEQVSPGHGGDKAGMAAACGNVPRQVAALLIWRSLGGTDEAMAALSVVTGRVGGVAAVARGGLVGAVGAALGAHGLAQLAMIGTVPVFRQPGGGGSMYLAAG